MAILRFIYDGLKLAIQVAAIVFVMKSIAFAHNRIPSESMVPTLEVGDRLFADKTAYGWSKYSVLFDPGITLPGKNGRIWNTSPKRGDVITFVHPKNGETYIKRVIGLPGDRVALNAGRLYINDEIVPRVFKRQYSYREFEGLPVTVSLYDEFLPEGKTHQIIEQSDSSIADNFPTVTVPKGHFFAMGDNRDNSSDSRFSTMGFVPLENLLGKARIISFSLYDCVEELGLTCARNRLLSPIR